MKNLIHKIIGLIWIVHLLVVWGNFGFATEGSNYSDLLEQAFTPAIHSDVVVGGDSIGTNVSSVGGYVLKWGTKFDVGEAIKKNKDETKSAIKKRASLLIQISKFLLRMTVVLAITMIIYNGIMYLVKASKGENPKEIISNLMYILGGVLLALMSVMIIRLVASIGTSSLNSI